MKPKFLLFGVVFAVFAFLIKRLLDTQEKLVIAEAERDTLQREQDAIKESFMEANQRYEVYNAENPLPDDPDKKLRVAMLDAIHSANARDILGDNHIDYESFDEEQEEDS